MADVFISYARTERARAETIKANLERLGLSVFLDIDGLDGGDVFPDVLDREVKAAGAVLALWSPHALARPWIKQECLIGLKRKVLIPLALEPLGELDVPVAFEGLHHIDFTGFHGDIAGADWRRLVRSLARTLGRPDLLKAEATDAPAANEGGRGMLDAGPERRRDVRALRTAAGMGILLLAIGGVWLAWELELLRLASSFEDRIEASPAVGETFRDCVECPEMVVIPAGTFVMGSPASETGRRALEGPRRSVSIAAFAAGKFEVTWEEWNACVAAGGCGGYRPDDADWGQGRRPVINVSWADAQGYVRWLSERTGRPYRLFTEAEWEYAARAGSTTTYMTGDQLPSGWANHSSTSTQPVGSYYGNVFGLHDMIGNVWEWVQDCFAESYASAPQDGSAVVAGDCNRRVLRGGSYADDAPSLRSAHRGANGPALRYANYGFRIARDLG